MNVWLPIVAVLAVWFLGVLYGYIWGNGWLTAWVGTPAERERWRQAHPKRTDRVTT